MSEKLQSDYEQLKSITTALEADYDKFNEKKIKASGQRMRNGLLNIKKLCDVIRKQIKDEMDAIPIKHRSKSPDKTGSDEETKSEPTPETKSKTSPKVKPKRTRKENPPKPIITKN